MSQRADRLARFDDAKFGLFVHWGPYSVAGVEASWPVMLGSELFPRFVGAMQILGMDEVDYELATVSYDEYRALPSRFDPVAFDAAAWVDLARAAGQRYLVFTTKHHDGFRMFDSAGSPDTIVHTRAGRDATAELAAACADGGIGFGTYFSCPDLADPGYRDLAIAPPENFLGQPERGEWASFLDRVEAQVRELCTNYGELFSFWWDLGFGAQYQPDRFHSLVRALQPDVLVNDRLGIQAADFVTPEQSLPRSIPRRSRRRDPPDLAMLFSVLRLDGWQEIVEQFAPMVREAVLGPDDRSLPAARDFERWEACMTFGGSWAYNPNLARCKTGDDIVVDLVEVASRGGNLLMNVGPMPSGEIQPEFTTALRDVGRWLERNGESIYGTTFGPVQGVEGVRSTALGDRVFLHVLGAPNRSSVRVPYDRPARSVRVLADGLVIDVEQQPDGFAFVLPASDRPPVVTTVEVLR